MNVYRSMALTESAACMDRNGLMGERSSGMVLGRAILVDFQEMLDQLPDHLSY